MSTKLPLTTSSLRINLPNKSPKHLTHLIQQLVDEHKVALDHLLAEVAVAVGAHQVHQLLQGGDKGGDEGVERSWVGPDRWSGHNKEALKGAVAVGAHQVHQLLQGGRRAEGGLEVLGAGKAVCAAQT